MRTVPLSDSVYAEATQAAAEVGMDIQSFITDAIRRRLEDVSDSFFSSERLGEIELARSEAREGRNLTMAQVREEIATQRKEWLESRPA